MHFSDAKDVTSNSSFDLWLTSRRLLCQRGSILGTVGATTAYSLVLTFKDPLDAVQLIFDLLLQTGVILRNKVHLVHVISVTGGVGRASK